MGMGNGNSQIWAAGSVLNLCIFYIQCRTEHFRRVIRDLKVQGEEEKL